ncbi:MAG TPA: ABC transporter permease [Ktedonobacterales bacterium]
MAMSPARTAPAPDTPGASSASPGAQSRAPAQNAPPRRRRSWLARSAASALAPVALGVVALLIWQLVTQSGAVNAFLLPSPGQVAQSFISAAQSGLFLRYGFTTLAESLVGFALGAAVALPMGYAIARSRTLAAALEPYMAASQAIPAVALAPLLVLWLPGGLAPIALLCALIVFFPAAINTTLGFRRLDHEIVDAARIDGAGGWSLLRYIETPLALPTVLAGLRTSLTLSITGAVVGEFVLSDQGLGGLLTIAHGNFDAPLVFATLIALAILAMGLYGVARLLEWFLVYLED